MILFSDTPHTHKHPVALWLHCPAHWGGRSSSRPAHLHPWCYVGWSTLVISCPPYFSLLLTISALSGCLWAPVMTHIPNVSHLVKWTIVFKVERCISTQGLFLSVWGCERACVCVCVHVSVPEMSIKVYELYQRVSPAVCQSLTVIAECQSCSS